jgi:hypothetical protein
VRKPPPESASPSFLGASDSSGLISVTRSVMAVADSISGSLRDGLGGSDYRP